MIFGKAAAKNRAIGNNILFFYNIFSIWGRRERNVPCVLPGGAYVTSQVKIKFKLSNGINFLCLKFLHFWYTFLVLSQVAVLTSNTQKLLRNLQHTQEIYFNILISSAG